MTPLSIISENCISYNILIHSVYKVTQSYDTSHVRSFLPMYVSNEDFRCSPLTHLSSRLPLCVIEGKKMFFGYRCTHENADLRTQLNLAVSRSVHIIGVAVMEVALVLRPHCSLYRLVASSRNLHWR